MTQAEVDALMDESSDDGQVKPTWNISDGAKGKSERAAWAENKGGQVKVNDGVDKSSTFHVPVMPDSANNMTRL